MNQSINLEPKLFSLASVGVGELLSCVVL